MVWFYGVLALVALIVFAICLVCGIGWKMALLIGVITGVVAFIILFCVIVSQMDFG